MSVLALYGQGVVKRKSHSNERQGNRMTTKLFGYTVSAPKRMIKQIKKDRQDKSCRINWFNFSIGNIFYTDNGDYQVSMADHKNKIIWFSHP